MGQTAYYVAQAGLTGYMATVANLKQDVSEWRCGGAPLTVSQFLHCMTECKQGDETLQIIAVSLLPTASQRNGLLPSVSYGIELSECCAIMFTGNDVSKTVAARSWCFSNWKACCAYHRSGLEGQTLWVNFLDLYWSFQFTHVVNRVCKFEVVAFRILA